VTGVVWDGASVFFASLIGVASAVRLGLMLSDPRRGRRRGADVVLLLFSTSGAVLVIAAADILVLFVGLVLLTVPGYAMPDRRHGHPAAEGAVRRFLLGATSTATVVYGIALLYGAIGQTSYAGLGRATQNPLYLAGLALVCAGLAAHLVHAAGQRSSIVSTVATIGALLRFAAATRNGDAALDWEVTFAILGAAALAGTAFASLAERRLGRLVTYLAIFQLGYVAIGAAASAAPAAAVATAVYAAVAIGLFSVLSMLPGDDPTLGDLAGLARRRPLLVVALGVLVVGAIGIPPAAGFIGRLSVFEAAVRAQLLWLVVLGALATVGGAVSYGRIVRACFAPPRLDAVTLPRAHTATAVVLVVALALLLAGIVPGPLLDAAQVVRF